VYYDDNNNNSCYYSDCEWHQLSITLNAGFVYNIWRSLSQTGVIISQTIVV